MRGSKPRQAVSGGALLTPQARSAHVGRLALALQYDSRNAPGPLPPEGASKVETLAAIARLMGVPTSLPLWQLRVAVSQHVCSSSELWRQCTPGFVLNEVVAAEKLHGRIDGAHKASHLGFGQQEASTHPPRLFCFPFLLLLLLVLLVLVRRSARGHLVVVGLALLLVAFGGGSRTPPQCRHRRGSV